MLVLGREQESVFGKMAIFFGTRTSKDLLFRGDLETAARLGALNSMKIVFSRQAVRIHGYLFIEIA